MKRFKYVSNWRKLYPQVVLFLVVYLISSCNSLSSKQFYENPDSGVVMEMPRTWDVTYNERNGVITLVSRGGIWSKDSARVEIYGPACGSSSVDLNNLTGEINRNIERIRILYNLETVTIVRKPTNANSEDYEIVTATIAIPTSALPKDSARNQVGNQGSDTLQEIEIIALSNNENAIMAYIYKGNSEELNIQAQEIVDSLQTTCP